MKNFQVDVEVKGLQGQVVLEAHESVQAHQWSTAFGRVVKAVQGQMVGKRLRAMQVTLTRV